MDDPWDVKSVRKSGQYTSCMKLNGVPLLPPVLSKECRSEMQYYKLLAKEVEKRISILQPYIESDTESTDDKTDAPEIVDCLQECDNDNQAADGNTNQEIVKVTEDMKEMAEEQLTVSPHHNEVYNFTTKHSIVTDSSAHPHLIVDFRVNINETIREDTNVTSEKIPNNTPSETMEVPERDYNCTKSIDLIQDVEVSNTRNIQKKETAIEEIVNFSFSLGREASLDSAIQESISQEGPPSLSSKSFTGSLNNIHVSDHNELLKPLVRQHSYTILNPSPQLLAHLEVQSLNLGVDMSCISMSESLTNLGPGKKRRSWDLETAKAKWSNMAMELKQSNLSRSTRRNTTKQLPRTSSPSRAKCVAAARTKYSSLSLKHTAKNEAIPRARTSSPPRSTSPSRTRTSSPIKDIPSASTIILEEPMTFRMVREPKTVSVVKESKNNKKTPYGEGSKTELPKSDPLQNQNCKNSPQKASTPQSLKSSQLVKSPTKSNGASKPGTPKRLSISEADDPATRVRELYEKIQKQQLIQMASLVEKQKREQILLQQAFEEQNNLLFKQLKTICPKSPDKIKEAWVEKSNNMDRPVSLSQVINHSSPLSSTLNDSSKYISYCDDILKKSKDISSTLKSSRKQNGGRVSPNINAEVSGSRPNSPVRKSTPTSRRLNYETSASSERDYELMLTERTNDTLADLNVTFPSDSEEWRPGSRQARSPRCAAEVTVIHRTTPVRSTDSAIKCMEQTIHKSINSCSVRARNFANCQPSSRQLAAATTIVAYAKGFLVRRLMKTARVQATVQTIKDALLCALQLHQDREGIRGADVDLHRRLIQQITAACYSLHDTFITSSAGERCALLAADRSRRASLASRATPPAHHKHRHSDVMSQSHSGAFPPRQKRHSSVSPMTQSNYETYSSEAARRRRPWR